MARTIAIHQPLYLPYLGFFDKMRKADVFVFLDDVKYSNGNFFNRNQIKAFNGVRWLTVPLQRGSSSLPINKVLISRQDWMTNHLNIISACYRDAPNYAALYPYMIDLIGDNPLKLIDLNIRLTKAFMEMLDIDTKILMASDLRIKTTSTQRLVDICVKLEATEYLSGIGGYNYIEESLFEEAGIKLTYQKFEHPVYEQLHGKFISNLSTLDYLMNEGDLS